MRFEAAALVDLGRLLRESEYAFTTVSPETHRIVDARAADAGHRLARSVRDVFGWSRPFARGVLPPRIFEGARAAGVLREDGAHWRATVRFSSLADHLFVHSSYPTTAPDSVFFGPDTYRFASLALHEAARMGGVRTLVDVGCGTGAGGISLGRVAERLVLTDINPTALAFADVNRALAGLTTKTELVLGDVLSGVAGDIDLLLANPPFMADGESRTYRDGGGELGEALALRIVREGLARLARGGRLILYTGAAVVDGKDVFRAAVRPVMEKADVTWSYREIDPDIFGDEIEHNAEYAAVERIAAVALVADKR